MISSSKVTLLYFAREALVVGCLCFADCGCDATMLGCPRGTGVLCPLGCAAPALGPGARGAVLEIPTAALQTHVLSSSHGRQHPDLASGAQTLQAATKGLISHLICMTVTGFILHIKHSLLQAVLFLYPLQGLQYLKEKQNDKFL